MKKFFPQMETINEASKISGLAKYRIRQMVLQNKVKYVRAGKKYLINIESLIEYPEFHHKTALSDHRKNA